MTTFGSDDLGSGHDPASLLAFAIGRQLPFREFGTSVLCPGYHSLYAMARTVASLQSLSGNRLVVGLGSGMRPEVNRVFGLDDTERRRRTVEARDVLPGLLAGRGTGLPDDVTFYTPPMGEVPLLLASGDPQMFAGTDRTVVGWMSMLRSAKLIRETGEQLRQVTGRPLRCAMQVTLEPDVQQPMRPPTMVPTATVPALAVGTRLLPAVFVGYARAGVDRMLIHLPTDDNRWTRLHAIAAAARQARAELAGADVVPAARLAA
ncbi:MAG: hypothetical protein AUI14_06225 [Actinobacteria bacterium 13_2_20CM_2_71_6]|nr:MAG: hypothetical protein AUI14_06225 [Actinobacteria bacterium 13_2_20CM_2_71_6]